MDQIKKEVEHIRGKWFRCPIIKEAEYGTSLDGTPYAMLVTKGIWSKVWIISYIKTNQELGEDSLTEKGIVNVRENPLPTEEVETFLKNCKKELAEGRNDCLLCQTQIDDWSINHILRCPLPLAVFDNPDEYIAPGEIICTQFAGAFQHTAIYIGNGQVVHVSGHGGGTSDAVARIGSFRHNFAPKKESGEQEEVFILRCRYQIRTPEKIVEIAKKFAKDGYSRTEYNLLAKNCQHFVTLCAFGIEFSFDVAEIKKAVLYILGAILRKNQQNAN